MGRLIFVNRFFYPDDSATSQLVSDLAFEMTRRGQSVVVITSRSSYHSLTRLPGFERINGVDVYRTGSTHFGRQRPLGRMADYLTFYVTCMWRLLRLTQRDDVIVALTDPPLINVATLLVARLTGARNLSWAQDLFPEVAIRASIGTRFQHAVRVAGTLLGGLATQANRGSDAVIVLGEGMRSKMLAKQVRPERLHLISNWSDLERVRPIAREDNALRQCWAPADEFIVGYSGNMGIAHDLQPLLLAADRLRREHHIRFVLIGDGQQRATLEKIKRERGLDNVSFYPYQPRDLLHLSLSAIDLHIVSLRPAMESLIVPSKFFGVAAAGRPSLFIGAADGEIASLIAKHSCGLTVAPDDVDALTEAIRALALDRHRCGQMGLAARAMAEREFGLSRTVELWHELLKGLGTGKRGRHTTRRLKAAKGPEREAPTSSGP